MRAKRKSQTDKLLSREVLPTKRGRGGGRRRRRDRLRLRRPPPRASNGTMPSASSPTREFGGGCRAQAPRSCLHLTYASAGTGSGAGFVAPPATSGASGGAPSPSSSSSPVIRVNRLPGAARSDSATSRMASRWFTPTTTKTLPRNAFCSGNNGPFKRSKYGTTRGAAARLTSAAVSLRVLGSRARSRASSRVTLVSGGPHAGLLSRSTGACEQSRVRMGITSIN